MATPTKSQAASTPKNHPSNTPNRLMASPRPGNAGAAQRPFAYKSPAVKTPASIHSHAHHVSASSQPSSTPLAAAAVHDDLLGLSSPAAALIASIPATGLTPLPNVQDGLGLPAHMQGTSSQDAAVPRNPELEKLQRLQSVTDNLETRKEGKGVSRENVERVAKLRGFTPFWDEDNLTIAGTRVDLEIFFDAQDRNVVKDVVLKLNTLDGDELQPQKEASEVLKNDLSVASISGDKGPWRSLDSFSGNLKLLSQLDDSDLSTNRFQVMDSLYDTLRAIWDEEKKRMKWSNNLHHMRHGNVGRPWMHIPPHLGLSVGYWESKAELRTAMTDPNQDSEDDKLSAMSQGRLWKARFACAAGGPTITSQKWLAEDIMIEDTTSDHPLDSDISISKPNWQDPNPADPAPNGQEKAGSDPMDLNKPSQLGVTLNGGFICTLEPLILLPINVAASLNMGAAIVEIDQAQAITYHQALQQERNRKLDKASAKTAESRWQRSVPVFLQSGDYKPDVHSYALYSTTVGTELWCLPIKDLKLSHPRQFAAVLPTLRGYAVLWALLTSLTESTTAGQPNQGRIIAADEHSPSLNAKKTNSKTNARSSRLSKFDSFLEKQNPTENGNVLPVDVSLDIITDPIKPKLDVLIPIQDAFAPVVDLSFIQFSVVIEPGGKIVVSAVQGVTTSSLDTLKLGLSRVLTVSEDLGIAVEWLLQKLRR